MFDNLPFGLLQLFDRKVIFSSLLKVTLLSRIHHRNLVTFLGYSQQDGKNILVYEFMHNGTLKEHLRGKFWIHMKILF